MKTSEFMIGNIVDKGFIIATTPRGATIQGGALSFPVEYKWHELSPIVITGDLLLSLEFEKKTKNSGAPMHENMDSFSLDGYEFMEDVSGNWFLCGYNWNTKHFKYLHELQNLFFALSGEEMINTKKDWKESTKTLMASYGDNPSDYPYKETLFPEKVKRANETLKNVDLSPLFCEHANEVPGTCNCKENCYCKTHSCKQKESEHTFHCNNPSCLHCAYDENEEIEDTWTDVIESWAKTNYGVDEKQLEFYYWLKENYNNPTKKND